MSYIRFKDADLTAKWDRFGHGNCDSLDRLSPDQRNTVAEHCPMCRGEPGRCLVEVMEEVVAATQPADKNDNEILPI